MLFAVVERLPACLLFADADHAWMLTLEFMTSMAIQRVHVINSVAGYGALEPFGIWKAMTAVQRMQSVAFGNLAPPVRHITVICKLV